MKQRHYALLTSLALGLAWSIEFDAQGADISAGIDENGNDIILLRGPIEPGDAAKVHRLKRQLGDYRRTGRELVSIHLNSAGGSFNEALKIADLVHGPPIDTALGTVIGRSDRCFSACALIFMAGLKGGASWAAPDRKLHYQGQLGFHAPYLTNIQGQFSGGAIELTYKTAVASMRQSMKKNIIPQSLLIEMLGKGPTDFFYVDTIDKAGRWDIDVFGFEQRPTTRQMFCTACMNHRFWIHGKSAAGDLFCEQNGSPSGSRPVFKMRQIGTDYSVKILFPSINRPTSECKLHVRVQDNKVVHPVTGRFGPPEGDFVDYEPLRRADRDTTNSFLVLPFHYYVSTLSLRVLGR